MLRRLVGVLLGVNGMALRSVCVVGRRLVIAGFVVLGRFQVMFRCFFVMVCSLLVVLRALMVSHCRLLTLSKSWRTRADGHKIGAFRRGLLGRRPASVGESWITNRGQDRDGARRSGLCGPPSMLVPIGRQDMLIRRSTSRRLWPPSRPAPGRTGRGGAPIPW